MKLTLALKNHLIEALGVPADATDEVFRTALTKGLFDGKITLEKVAELTKAEADASEARLALIVAKALDSALNARNAAPAGQDAVQVATKAHAAVEVGAGAAVGSTTGTKAMAAAALAGGTAAEFEGDATQVRVKSAAERYHHNPSNVTWDMSKDQYAAKALGGRPVQSFSEGNGRVLETETDRTKAVVGVWMKHKLHAKLRMKGIPHKPMTEHEIDLLNWTLHNVKFTGPIGCKEDNGFRSVSMQAYYDNERLSEPHIKALLDGATSGGLEAVPIWFDDAVITTPLLEGELFPLVDVVDVERRRIEGVTVSNPTLGWGTAEGTAITPFTTDAFVAAFDNTIWPVTGAMEIGKDFLSDSPTNMGQIVRARYGAAFLKEMDDVIANGNGTDRPTGLFITSGVTSLTPAGGAGAAAVVGDYEALAHGITKPFQNEAGKPPNSRMVFVGTQTSYKRARGLAVGTADQRRIFGTDNQFDYMLMGLRYRIASTDALTNAKIGCFCMNRYRLYRRQGLEIDIIDGDRTGALANTVMLVVRARFGGGLTHSGAGTKSTNAQA